MIRKDSTILVTGGSRGIGAETVLLLAEQGYDICFTYLKQKAAAKNIVDQVQSKGGRAWAIQIDSENPNTAEQLLSQALSFATPLVGLVNNVGITGPKGSFAEINIESIKQVFDVNVLGTFSLTQKVVKHWLQKSQPGVIVNVSSIAATTGSPGEYVHYASSKAAIDAFTIGLGKELAPHSIRVNCVSPGTCLTEIHAAAGDADKPNRLAAKIPMGRAGEPKEIAQAIAWLISNESSYVNGTILRVAGGL